MFSFFYVYLLFISKMIENIFVAISLGIILAFTIGPVFFILIETSITKGMRSALAFDFGAISGDIFFITLAYWGTSKLANYIEDNPNLFIYGGIIIIIYGWSKMESCENTCVLIISEPKGAELQFIPKFWEFSS